MIRIEEQDDYKLSKTYKPNHDPFYRWLVKDPERIKDLVRKSVEPEFDGELQGVEFEYSNEYTDGFWDLRFRAVSEQLGLDQVFLVEYKPDIKCDSVEGTLRQMKKRMSVVNKKSTRFSDSEFELAYSGEHDCYRGASMILATFDPRYKSYTNVLENEEVNLVVYEEEDRRSIAELTDAVDVYGKQGI